MPPGSGPGNQSPSVLLRSKKLKPRQKKDIFVPREWVWIWGPWIFVVCVGFIFTKKEQSLAGYYRHEIYINGSALSRKWAMALVKGLLYYISKTLSFFREKVGPWIQESWKNRPDSSRHFTDKLPESYAWILMGVAGVTLFVILACFRRLLHLTKQFAIAGWTPMWRFVQTCINFPSEWWKSMLQSSRARLGWKPCIGNLKVQNIWPQSSWTFFSWPQPQHLMVNWWRSMPQFRKARIVWKPCIGNLKVQSIRVQSGLKILRSILFGVILIFLIWGIRETLNSPKFDGSFWALLNAQI